MLAKLLCAVGVLALGQAMPLDHPKCVECLMAQRIIDEGQAIAIPVRRSIEMSMRGHPAFASMTDDLTSAISDLITRHAQLALTPYCSASACTAQVDDIDFCQLLPKVDKILSYLPNIAKKECSKKIVSPVYVQACDAFMTTAVGDLATALNNLITNYEAKNCKASSSAIDTQNAASTPTDCAACDGAIYMAQEFIQSPLVKDSIEYSLGSLCLSDLSSPYNDYCNTTVYESFDDLADYICEMLSFVCPDTMNCTRIPNPYPLPGEPGFYSKSGAVVKVPSVCASFQKLYDDVPSKLTQIESVCNVFGEKQQQQCHATFTNDAAGVIKMTQDAIIELLNKLPQIGCQIHESN